MADVSDRQIEGGIRFGDWMLVGVDERNWELCHRHVAKATGRNKGGTEAAWHRLGRFYSFNTVHLAIQYAADCELKAKARDAAMELADALGEYRAIVDALKADVLAAVAP